MLLSRLHLNPRSREARRDLADPYQLHATLSRAFAPPESKCAPGAFLWRLEPEGEANGAPCVLVQSWEVPAWGRLNLPKWLVRAPEPVVDLTVRLNLEGLRCGQRFRFRLRANPSVVKNGRRTGLLQPEAQEAWLIRKGRDQHGFKLLPREGPDFYAGVARPAVGLSQAKLLLGRQASGNAIQVYSVLFDGVLEVEDPVAFRAVLASGLGHGKALGLGLLSVVPVR